jgi:hypothetical protein
MGDGAEPLPTQEWRRGDWGVNGMHQSVTLSAMARQSLGVVMTVSTSIVFALGASLLLASDVSANHVTSCSESNQVF